MPETIKLAQQSLEVINFSSLLATSLNSSDYPRRVRIGYNNDMPYSYILPNGEMIWSLEPMIISTITNHLNISVELIDCNNVFGVRDQNGQWTGSIGKLIRKEIDMAIGGFVVTPQRESVVQFLYPHTIDNVVFATAWPDRQMDYEQLFRPFSISVWVLLSITFLLIYLLDFLTSYLNHEDRQRIALKAKQISFRTTGLSFVLNRFKNHRIAMFLQRFQLKNSAELFWISFRLLLKQPCKGMRINLWMFWTPWLICVVLMTVFYASFLCSILTFPYLKAIDSIQKLADACLSNNLLPISLDNSSLTDSIMRSREESFRIISNKLILMNSTEDAMRMVVNGRFNVQQYAMILSESSLRYYERHFGEETLYIPPVNLNSTFSTILISIPIRREFPFLKHFNRLVFILAEAGFFNHWLDRRLVLIKNLKKNFNVLPKRPRLHRCRRCQTKYQHHFTLDHLGSVFHVHFFFLTISFFIFILEVLLR